MRHLSKVRLGVIKRCPCGVSIFFRLPCPGFFTDKDRCRIIYMETQFSPLVLTKICIPALRQRIIHRPALLDRIASQTDKGFVLVSAPAGYGKTTLLIDLAQKTAAQGNCLAWYALDADDDNPVSFGAYLVASLMQAFGSTPEFSRLAQGLRTSMKTDLHHLMQTVINTLALRTERSLLILDDYHLIRSPAIHTAMTYLLEHLPQNLRVVIGSRSDPPFPLARMRVHASLLEIRSADLRFTREEATKFLNDLMQLGLSPESISLLEKRAEGWVAGLQLAALSLSGRSDRDHLISSFGGGHRYLVEYLLEEVVERQPEEVRTFLLATSVLDRMCASLCDALPDIGSGSQGILEYLTQANLFLIALDEQENWFRYHHLFRDFLYTRLTKTQPGRLIQLYRAACAWLSENQLFREAAQHAFRTKDWEFAATFVEENHFYLIIHGEIATLFDWCMAFPEEVKQAHPLLYILECWALVFSYRRENRSRVEARLAQAEEAANMLQDARKAGDLLEHAAVVRTFLAMAPDPTADPYQCLDAINQFPGVYADGDPGKFSALLTSSYAYMALQEVNRANHALETARRTAASGGLFFGVVESIFHLARLAHSQGKLKESAVICQQGQADLSILMGQRYQELAICGCLDIALGCVLLEQYELDEAEQHLTQGMEMMGWGSNPYHLMTGFSALYQLYLSRSLQEKALRCLDQLEEKWQDISFYTRVLRIVPALRNAPDNPAWREKAQAWCSEFAKEVDIYSYFPGLGPFGGAEIYYRSYLAWIELQIICDQVQAARVVLDAMLEKAETNGLLGRLMDLKLLDALCSEKQGDLPRALNALEPALSAARKETSLYCFNLGATMRKLLELALPTSQFRSEIEKILSLFFVSSTVAKDTGQQAAAYLAHELGIVETLSEREMDVLRLMAQGASNQSIANQLVITVGTVKSHVNHILGKLNAQNRTEAVARARQLGLE